MVNTPDLITTERHGSGILQLHLNQPERLNVLSRELLSLLSQHLEQARQDTAVKAILLTGAGKAFCAGADIHQLAALTKEDGVAFAEYGQAVMNQLELLGKPSLAAIQGFALGGGCELAMAATLRIATSDAVFGQPEVKLGVIPGFGGTQRLSRMIGKGRALEMCLSGQRFTAEEAYLWGLVNEVVASDHLISHALQRLEALIQSSSIAMRYIMAAINEGYDLTMESALAVEAAYFGDCCASDDKQEGVKAFLEKRKPVFTGK